MSAARVRLEAALRAAGSHPDRSGRHWRCPVQGHGRGRGDVNPSLVVDEGQDGRALLHCEAGCPTMLVISELGLEMADLFAREREGGRDPSRRAARLHDRDERGGNPRTSGVHGSESSHARLHAPDCTLEAYTEAKRLPVEFLRRLGIREAPYQGGVALRIPYLDESGEEAAIRFRLRLESEDKDAPRFKWRSGCKAVLYGLQRLANAKALRAVVLVEGESDTQTLLYHGIPSLGVPGATSWKREWAETLDGIETIFAIREPGKAGSEFIRRVAESGLADRLRVVDLGDAKDPSGLHVRDPERFEEDFGAALDASMMYMEERRAEAEAAADAAFEQCADLARSPRILDVFAERLRCRGVVGEERLAKIIYLAMVSRLLPRPVSIVVKALSSAGKSYTTQNVVAFFPASAFYSLTAMSEHALAYSEEPLSHRMIVIFEAAGLEGDFASYLLRSLLSEGCVRYETVEKTSEGLRARLIERPGPTGCIVTTTKLSLHPENETRMLSVPADDSEEQTRRILVTLAEEHDHEDDLDEWHALQGWLEGAERRVAIPFAGALAERVPPVAVRLRRDFGQLLNLIRAHALLHQATRDRDEDGRIVATLEDYAVVRDLVADLVGEAVEATVSNSIRETVTAIANIIDGGKAHASVADLARALGLETSAARRRAYAAAAKGYIRNIVEKKGQPARYVAGDALPEDRPLLPESEELVEGVQACEGVQARLHGTSPRNQEGNGQGVQACRPNPGGNEDAHEPEPPDLGGPDVEEGLL